MNLRPWKRRPKTVSLPLWHGATMTLPEPAWCAGHEDAVPEHPVDARHIGTEVPCFVDADGQTFEVLAAAVVHEPFSERDSLPAVSVDLGADGYRRFSRAELLEFADRLERHARFLRELGDDVEELREAMDAEADE
jgi:hypothetical protein